MSTLRSTKLETPNTILNIRMLLLGVAVVTVCVGIGWLLLRSLNSTGTGPSSRSVTSSKPNAQPNFEATIVNTNFTPSSLPDGMVYIPGGEFSMGSLDPTEMVCGGDQPMDDARPLHRVYVDPFFMDATEVTNEQF
jgi:formylglycine-generating enzyme required for sulfatase activity